MQKFNVPIAINIIFLLIEVRQWWNFWDVEEAFEESCKAKIHDSCRPRDGGDGENDTSNISRYNLISDN